MKAQEILETFAPSSQVISQVKNLETNNLLKNAFINELAETYERHFDKDKLIITDKGAHLIAQMVFSQSDGLIQNSGELSDINAHVTVINNVLKEL